MASKPSSTSSGPPEHNMPPALSFSNQLLASSIRLPPNPSIAYATYHLAPSNGASTSSATADDAVEIGRRLMVGRNSSAGTAILDSILPSVRKGDEHEGNGGKVLHVFAVAAAEQLYAVKELLQGLQLEGLSVYSSGSFTPRELYPCSAACASQLDACPVCLSQTQDSLTPLQVPNVSTSTSSRRPRQHLRTIYSAFLAALRDRLIYDISEAALLDQRRQVRRYKQGFMLGPLYPHESYSASTEEEQRWGSGWAHYARMRPLIYCELSLHISPTRIIIHPVLKTTPYLPLSAAHSLKPQFASSPNPATPMPAGTPIVLLPHAVPAYFLTHYTGPTAALTAQFDIALLGMGVGRWRHHKPPSHTHKDSSGSSESGGAAHNSGAASYIIAWVSVENTQGEDKGITIIWPEALCLSYHPSAAAEETQRTPLAYLPTLPSQLQPSPLPPSPPTISFVTSSIPSTPYPDSQSATRWRSRAADRLRHGLSRRALTTTTLDSFHSLSLRLSDSPSSVRPKDLSGVATEVGAYVDSVAREREKERERIKRDKEVGGSPPKAFGSSLPRRLSMAGSGVESGEMGNPGARTMESMQAESAVTPLNQSYPSPPNITPTPSASNAVFAEPYVSDITTQEPSSMDHATDHIFKEEVSTPLAPTVAGEEGPSTPPLSSHPSEPNAFDPFSDMNLDGGWAQPQQDFLNLDYDMDFGMPADVGGAVTGAGGAGAGDSMMMNGFEDGFTFTDDDFSFFDQPATHATPQSHPQSRIVSGISAVASQADHTGLTPASFGLSPGFYGDIPSGLYPSSSPWVPGVTVDSSTPSLSPPSPGKSPVSHSAPTTPNVQLSPGYRDAKGKHTPTARLRPSLFDPIPFAVTHRLSDGKYAFGKFSLSLPNSSVEDTIASGRNQRYEAVTNPRVGVIRKLIGVKRKSTSHDVRDAKASAPWLREHEDWVSYLSPDNTVMEAEVGISEESEDEDLDLDSPISSRPSTPPPSYLPLGPTLLQTEFRHYDLLPLCNPLRPRGMAVAPTALTPAAAAASVPTPVSPAAALGAASEKCKSLEAAAYTMAKEAVENPVWATYATKNHALGTRAEVWQADVMAVAQLFEGIPALQGALDMQTVFNESNAASMPLEQLEPPMLTVAKSNAVMQVLPTALRFWERLGLGPRGGRKNVTAFVLFEDEGQEKQLQVEQWLIDMSTTYSNRHLGAHTAGRSTGCSRDGLVPLNFDSFRKDLASFVSNLPAFGSSVVFYLVAPSCSDNFASPVFRQVFTAVKRALKTYSEAQIVFQFVPQQLIADSLEHSSTRETNIERLCHTLYERILLPVDRNMSRRFFEHGERVRNYFQEPAFTLARPAQEKVKLLREMPPRSLDIVDRHTLLHVGYCITHCGKWLLATCVDQRGEVHEIGVWFLQSDMGSAQFVAQVWEFAVAFARRANVEWRIVIATLGLMDEDELNAWVSHLTVAVPACHELPMIHISLLSVDQDHSWRFIPPQTNTGRSEPAKRSSPKDVARTVYVDAEASTYVVFPTIPLTLCTSPHPPEVSYIPSTREVPIFDEVPLLPISSSALIRAPASGGHNSISMLQIHLLHTTRSPHSSLNTPDSENHKDITRNFYELSVLAAERWKFDREYAILPMHLGALQVMANIIGKADVENYNA